MRTRKSKYIFAKKKPLHKRVSARISDALPTKKNIYRPNYSFDPNAIDVSSGLVMSPNYSLKDDNDFSDRDFDSIDRFDEPVYSSSLDSINETDSGEVFTLDDDFLIRKANPSFFGKIKELFYSVIGFILNLFAGLSKRTALYFSGGILTVALIAVVAIVIVNTNTVSVTVADNSDDKEVEPKTNVVMIEKAKKVYS